MYFSRFYDVLAESIEPFLLANGFLKGNLSDDELVILNRIFLKLFQQDSTLGDLFNKKIEEYIDFLKKSSLNPFEARQEIEAIQCSLQNGEIVGYFFTGNVNVGTKHFEALLITSTQIIQPIYWADNFLESKDKKTIIDDSFYRVFSQVDLEEVFSLSSPNPEAFYNDDSNTLPKIPHIQADEDSCGTVSIACLKKLLQNNAVQLTDSSLIFSIYNLTEEKINLFFPSPSILIYSQSLRYINFLKSILSEEKTVEFEFNTYEEEFELYEIFTLQTVLKNSVEIAKEKNDQAIEEENLKTLHEILPDFRKKWLAEVEKIIEKRSKMNFQPKKYFKPHNFHLLYTCDRFSKIIKNSPAIDNLTLSHTLETELRNIKLSP